MKGSEGVSARAAAILRGRVTTPSEQQVKSSETVGKAGSVAGDGDTGQRAASRPAAEPPVSEQPVLRSGESRLLGEGVVETPPAGGQNA